MKSVNEADIAQQTDAGQPNYVAASLHASLSAQWIAFHLPEAQIQRILELAENVFGDREIAENWLGEPNLATDNKPPITLLGSEEGYVRVEMLLKRIDYGVLA